MGDLLVALDGADLVERLDLRRQPAVHAQHRVAHHRGDSEQVEHFAALVPRVGVAVLVDALVVEAVVLTGTAAEGGIAGMRLLRALVGAMPTMFIIIIVIIIRVFTQDVVPNS